MAQTDTKEYKSVADMNKGLSRMSAAGWEVASQSSYNPKKGCLRMLAGGFVFFNRKPRFVVVYRRAAPTA